MTQQLEYSGLNSRSSDPFDDMWEETHPNSTASWEDEDDVDDVDFDVMDDEDE